MKFSYDAFERWLRDAASIHAPLMGCVTDLADPQGVEYRSRAAENACAARPHHD
jgi:hypothetical protein